MTITYNFFDSMEGDTRTYNAADFANRFSLFFSNGVKLGSLAVTPNALSVNIASGFAHINGYHMENTATLNLTISANNSGLTRIDRVIVRLNLTTRLMQLAVIEGTPASTPIPPSLTRNSTIYELSLAQIRVVNGASTATITDERGAESVCGYIKVDSSIPTNEMWAHFTADWNEIKAEYDDWFDNRVSGASPTNYYVTTQPTNWVVGDIWWDLTQ